MADHIELEEYHKLVFNVLDTDGDGYLGAHQVREAFIGFGLKVALDEFDHALEELHQRDEYAFELEDIINIINQIYVDRYNSLIAKTHAVFDSHIHKKKKKLPTEEILSYIEEVGIEVENEEDVNNYLSKVDPNETGYIDYEAFEGLILLLRKKGQEKR